MPATRFALTSNRPDRMSTEQMSAARLEAGTRHGQSGLTAVRLALADIAAGRPVIVVDTLADQHAGYLLVAASCATAVRVAFLVRHTSGVLCVPLEAADCDRLCLPPMVRHNENPVEAAFTVSVDAVRGVTTGISAADRAVTIRLLGDPASTPDDFSRPGHILPMRARSGGVLERARYTEASVDLTRLAGVGSGGVIGAIVNDDGSEVTAHDLAAFAAAHRLRAITITNLIAFRLQECR